MPIINWADKVADAVTYLNTKGRVVKPAMALAIIDDVVQGGLSVDELAKKHSVEPDWIRTQVGHVTTATQDGGRVRPLDADGWYESTNDDQCYRVASGFAAAWKKARGLP